MATAKAAPTDDAARHKLLVDSITARARAIFDREGILLEAEIDTLSAGRKPGRFRMPSKAWRDYYHSLDWESTGLTESDLDLIYSLMTQYNDECYSRWKYRIDAIADR